MSSTPGRLRGHGVRPLLATALAVLATSIVATGASAATVDSGSLSWTLANTFAVSAMDPELDGDPNQPELGGQPYNANRNRTWLGHVTSSWFVTPQSAAGTVTPIGAATGPTVTTSSLRGPNELNTFVYSGAAGTYDEETGVGTIELEGGVQAGSPPERQNFTITLVDPVLELNGNTGRLYAHGVTGTSGLTSFDDTCVTVHQTTGPNACGPTHACFATPDDCPVMTLDLANATVTRKADGTRVIGPIAPAMARADWMSGYAVGAGPNRTPNIFGSFSIALKLEAEAPPVGPAGPAGPTGDAGPAGPAGKDGAEGKTINKVVTIVRRIQVVYLARAPFGKGAHEVLVTNRKGKLVARGRVKGSTLRLRLLKAAGAKKRLKGKYVLRAVGGKRRATVRLG
jgi:hypothetical protein